MHVTSLRRVAARMTFAFAALVAAAASASPVTDLPGRWAGWGSVVLSSGQSEQVKCVATYFVEGQSVRQNLRCASQSYKIDAIATLSVANGRVTGAWEERTWSVGGSVTGRVSERGFDLAINGPNFDAAMTVGGTNCKQSINIMPRGFEISKIALNLGKC
jgi:hypothetical protein